MTKEEIITKIKKDLKRYKTLELATRDETYELAYSMIVDYLEELLELSE